MNEPQTLTEARDEYLDWCTSHLNDKTVREYRNTINAMLRITGDLPLADFHMKHVEQFLTQMRRDHVDGRGNHRPPVGPRGWNSYLGRLRIFCRWLYSRGLVGQDVTAGIYRMRLPRRVRMRLTTDQAQAMLDSASCPRDRAVLALGFFAALRASEIRSLLIQDLDLDSGTLRVHVWKSDMEDDFPVSPDLTDELTTWLRHYRNEVLTQHRRKLAPSDFLIPSYHGHQWAPGTIWRDGRAYRPSAYRTVIPWKPLQLPHKVAKAALEAIGLPTQGEGMHTLRRASARILFDALIESCRYDSAIRIVQATLHHKTSATTEEYIGLSSEQLARDEFIRSTRLLQQSRVEPLTAVDPSA